MKKEHSIAKTFSLPLKFNPWPPRSLGAGFRQEWLTAANEEVNAGIETGAGLGNPMLTFWIERKGDKKRGRQYFDVDMRDVLRAAIETCNAP